MFWKWQIVIFDQNQTLRFSAFTRQYRYGTFSFLVMHLFHMWRASKCFFFPFITSSAGRPTPDDSLYQSVQPPVSMIYLKPWHLFSAHSFAPTSPPPSRSGWFMLSSSLSVTPPQSAGGCGRQFGFSSLGTTPCHFASPSLGRCANTSRTSDQFCLHDR